MHQAKKSRRLVNVTQPRSQEAALRMVLLGLSVCLSVYLCLSVGPVPIYLCLRVPSGAAVWSSSGQRSEVRGQGHRFSQMSHPN